MSAKQKASSAAHDQKFLMQVFFHFFPILQPNGCSKTTKAPFYIFRGYATYRRPKKIQKKFQKNSEFFSIFPSRGYCRREYLMY